MSKLSIVLDLKLLGKMWHGTRDEQTPQPVRMTLGNKRSHPPTFSLLSVVVYTWLFTVVHWCNHGLPQGINMGSVLFSFVILVIALLR